MIQLWFTALPLLLLMAGLGWLQAARRGNVNIVDSLWSLFFLVAAGLYLGLGGHWTLASLGLFCLVALWALRLSLYLTRRNAGKAEDRRYGAMRAADPHFTRRSLVMVFGLQAVLAWLLSLPLLVALSDPAPLQPLHWLGGLLFGIGFSLEALADRQLARFKADPEQQGRVMNRGLWRYSRHPNYFGEAVLWWGFGLFALASGAAWTLFAPLLMTFLLLKVSGVSLLERDIQERRPAYRDYMATTSPFIPWPPAKAAKHTAEEKVL